MHNPIVLRLRCLFYTGIAMFVLLVAFFPNAGRAAPTASMSATPPPAPETAAQAQTNQAFIEYQLYNEAVVIDNSMPPVLSNGQADYDQIYAEHNLCALIQAGEIDEVWIWTGNGDGVTKANMWEWTTSGPEWYGDAPDCGRVVTTMAYNYLREVDVALESFNHRLEGFFTNYFTCDLSTAAWPWKGSTTPPFSACGALLSDRYGFVARPFAGNGNVAACGDAHTPPNILTDNDPYNYTSTTTVSTICPDWSQDGTAQPTQVNCSAWNCMHWGFHQWWMQNIPGLNNHNRDRNGALHPNWWGYLFGRPLDQFKLFLPFLHNPATARNAAAGQTTSHSQNFATRPAAPVADRRPELPNGALISTRSNGTGPAVQQRPVFVIAYPGYGGTPRADVNVLTAELIGLLKEASVYHGYESSSLHGIFLGQDGQSYAGAGCGAGTAPDNIHIRLTGLRADSPITSYQVHDSAGHGLWAAPCNPVSNWVVVAQTPAPGQADLYFKPFRNAPAGTFYTVTVQYEDGISITLNVLGGEVHLRSQ